MKKKWNWLFAIVMCVISMQAVAANTNFPCVLRVAKTDCWPNFQISVQPIDANTQEPLGKPVVIDKNTNETEVLIPCHPKQEISFVATTLPAVWGATSDTQYPSNHFWETPEQLPSNADRWIISLCFATDFSSVPIPLSQKATCVCSFPQIENTKKSYSPAL